VCVCVCGFSYPACNAHAPFYLSVGRPAVQCFPTLSHKRYDFRKSVIGNTTCVLIFCTTLSEAFFVLRKTQWDIIINIDRSCMLSTRYSCQILTKLEVFGQILKKNTEIQNFMKFHPVGAELFSADGRTGVTQLIAGLSQFCEHACKKGYRPCNGQASSSKQFCTSHCEVITCMWLTTALNNFACYSGIRNSLLESLNYFHRRSDYLYEFLYSGLLTVNSRSLNDLGPFFHDIHLHQRFIYKKVKVTCTL
jgi:hypothetical protein